MNYLDLAKQAEKKLRASYVEMSQPAVDRESEPEQKPERPTPEDLTAQVLAEFQPNEADRIVTAWREILGVNLDREHVRANLEAIRSWQSRWHGGG